MSRQMYSSPFDQHVAQAGQFPVVEGEAVANVAFVERVEPPQRCFEVRGQQAIKGPGPCLFPMADSRKRQPYPWALDTTAMITARAQKAPST